MLAYHLKKLKDKIASKLYIDKLTAYIIDCKINVNI
ncbi:MAG: hypothetical protein ACI9VT_000443 [Psychroserpens sp.]|jgi:hypothetical protein